MNIKPNNFKDTTLQQIKWWAWAAAVLPIVGLASVFFVWTFGTKELFDLVMIVGEVTMFTIAVIWWWWAIFVINKVVHQWDETRQGVAEVLVELGEVKKLAKDTFAAQDDK